MKEIIELSNVAIHSKYNKEISSFDCALDRVNNFFRYDALIMHEKNMANTKLFFNEDDELVGYITLFNDTFRRINKQKLLKEKWDIDIADFYPAIRLHFMGVNKNYQGLGIGYTMLMEVFEICIEVSKKSGCTFLSVESFESSLEFYVNNGFRNMGKRGELYNMLFKIDELI